MIRTCLKINRNIILDCRCEERSDEAIHGVEASMDCHAPQRGTRNDNFFLLKYIDFSF